MVVERDRHVITELASEQGRTAALQTQVNALQAQLQALSVQLQESRSEVSSACVHSCAWRCPMW